MGRCCPHPYLANLQPDSEHTCYVSPTRILTPSPYLRGPNFRPPPPQNFPIFGKIFHFIWGKNGFSRFLTPLPTFRKFCLPPTPPPPPDYMYDSEVSTLLPLSITFGLPPPFPKHTCNGGGWGKTF